MKLFDTFLPVVGIIAGAAAIGLGSYIYSKARAEKETKEECASMVKEEVVSYAFGASATEIEDKPDDELTAAEKLTEKVNEAVDRRLEDAFLTTDECKDMEDGKKIAAAGVVAVLAGVSLFKATIKNKDITYNSLLFDIYDWRERWANRTRALSGLVNSLDRAMEGFGKEQEVSQLCQFDRLAVSLGEMRFRALSEMLASYDELFKRRLKKANYNDFTYVGLDLLDKYAYDEDYEL